MGWLFLHSWTLFLIPVVWYKRKNEPVVLVLDVPENPPT
jgi:hypothetical protein